MSLFSLGGFLWVYYIDNLYIDIDSTQLETVASKLFLKVAIINYKLITVK